MKRLHVHIRVDDLNQSIDFYTKLFGHGPVRRKDDYAKWSLSEPALNLAISSRGLAEQGMQAGIAHLGVEMDQSCDVANTTSKLDASDVWVEGETTCCYAHSVKSWARDPAGVEWELFHTSGASEEWGVDAPRPTACCA